MPKWIIYRLLLLSDVTVEFIMIIIMEVTGKGRACVPEGLTKA